MQFPATLVQLAEKPLPPHDQRGKILRLNISISCNFQQLWFSWQKSPLPSSGQRGKNSETEYIHFMQFPATLAQLEEKLPPATKEGKFWDWIYPFPAISSNFGSAGRNSPSPAAKEGKNSETESTHFMQFPATLVQLAEKPLTPATKEGKFLDWIYPFHAISSNFGSGGRKASPQPAAKEGKILRLNLSISCNFQHIWFSWQKTAPLVGLHDRNSHEDFHQ